MKTKATKVPLQTRWAKEVLPANALPKYPRPQMVRNDWLNLNGLWEYEITDANEKQPEVFSAKILVPYPIESSLSGVRKQLKPQERLWYKRHFIIPKHWTGKRILLHFGAVDWQATVYVNGHNLGTHQGGYDAFTFDITDVLKPDGSQAVVVKVYDPTDFGLANPLKAPRQPHGKQLAKPVDCRYSQSSGIWQTVWLEPVPQISIDKLKIVPNIDVSQLFLIVNATDANCIVEVVASDAGKKVAFATGKVSQKIKLPMKNAKLWSPDSPHLYDLKVILKKDGEIVDTVQSYFGMRKISIGKDEKGINRILLNNRFVFQVGPLDQGYWPDGAYTAPTDEALRYDIEAAKKLGFNMLRKHVKVEPDRWYYWCDKLGILVWQDMPSAYPAAGWIEREFKNTAANANIFETELKQMIDQRSHFPSIVMWIVFNETWGQYDTVRLTKLCQKLDPSRVVSSASGCSDFGVGDIIDGHQYPGPNPGPTKSSPDVKSDEWQWGVKAKPDPNRAVVLGEFGGVFYNVDGHMWYTGEEFKQRFGPFENAGYPIVFSVDELTKSYKKMLQNLRKLKNSNGISAAVYTSFVDIEIECNGFLTYDRKIIKVDVDQIATANKSVTRRVSK